MPPLRQPTPPTDLASLLSIRTGGASASPALFAVLLLAACGPGDNDPGPGGVTVGEARALDEAAAMLDEQRLPAEATAGPTPAAEVTQPAEPLER